MAPLALRDQNTEKRWRQHRSEDKMRGAIIPTVPGKTLHLSIICGFLLGAVTGWLTTITTHLSGRENLCLGKTAFLSHTSHLCHVTKKVPCIVSRRETGK